MHFCYVEVKINFNRKISQTKGELPIENRLRKKGGVVILEYEMENQMIKDTNRCSRGSTDDSLCRSAANIKMSPLLVNYIVSIW